MRSAGSSSFTPSTVDAPVAGYPGYSRSPTSTPDVTSPGVTETPEDPPGRDAPRRQGKDALPHPAEIDVVLARDDRHLWPFEPHLHVVRLRGLECSESAQHGTRRRDDDPCRAALEIRDLLLADRACHAQLIRPIELDAVA